MALGKETLYLFLYIFAPFKPSGSNKGAVECFNQVRTKCLECRKVHVAFSHLGFYPSVVQLILETTTFMIVVTHTSML